MSRIGKNPITIPDQVTVSISGSNVNVKGPKGELNHSVLNGIEVVLKDSQLIISKRKNYNNNAIWGLERSLIANMVFGVSQGFEKTLELVGIGYRAKIEGTDLVVLAGYSHPVKLAIPSGLTVEVKDEIKIRVFGTDKQAVGQFAAQIRKIRPPEPYKGKGIKYLGEVIKRKAGKSGKAGASGAG